MIITVNFEAVVAWGHSAVTDEDVEVDVPEDFYSWPEGEQQMHLQDEARAWCDQQFAAVVNILPQETEEEE